MRKLISIAVLLTLVVAFAVPASAQDDGMLITCDSTLLTLVLIAENDYGFHSMYDLSTYEKGGLAPLFDAMMANMDEMMDEGDDMMDEGDEMMDEGDDMMMDDMMMLAPGDVTDEPTECTDLRAEVESFLYDALSAELMMADDSM